MSEGFIVLKRQENDDLLEGTLKLADSADADNDTSQSQLRLRLSAKRAAVNHDEGSLSLERPWQGEFFISPGPGVPEEAIGSFNGATR